MHKEFGELGRVVFELCERTDRQTDRQTDVLIIILRTTSGGKVITDFANDVYLLIFIAEQNLVGIDPVV